MAVDRNHGNEACRLHVARAAFDDMNGMRVPRGDIHCTAAEGRRVRGDLIEAFKAINGLTQYNSDMF